jgi:hypothetical protein
MTMICEVRLGLLSDYRNATAAYAHSVAELQRKIGLCSKSEYIQLKRQAEESKQETVKAESQLERHVAEHGCEAGTSLSFTEDGKHQ